jgi:hypothetical protein
MSKYARRSADNDIDFSILGYLTDQDLKDLGGASLGHRREILRAIVFASLGIWSKATMAALGVQQGKVSFCRCGLHAAKLGTWRRRYLPVIEE